MEMVDDDVVVAGRRALAQGRGLDVVLAAVRRGSSGPIAEIARLRGITGLGLADAQRVLSISRDLAHVGQRELDLIHSFPQLAGEYASVIRKWYVDAVLHDEAWLTATPGGTSPLFNGEESDVYWWWSEGPGPVDGPGLGVLDGTGFDTFRAEMRAVPDDPPRFTVVTDTSRVFTCRFALTQPSQ